MEKYFAKKFPKDKKFCKIRDNCCFTGNQKGAAHGICNIRFNVFIKFLLRSLFYHKRISKQV